MTRKINFIGIAGMYLLAISFCNKGVSQNTTAPYLTKKVSSVCEPITNTYLELGSMNEFSLTDVDSLTGQDVEKVKFKSKEIKLFKSKSSAFSTAGEANKAGTASIQTTVYLSDGSKIRQTYAYTVVELPELEVAITVTSPDSKFMWLNLIDKNTGQSANASFNLCSIEFELTDSVGRLKEKGVTRMGDDYFPSVTLSELPVKFELKDRLKLAIAVLHYEFNLPVYINQELVIQHLWN